MEKDNPSGVVTTQQTGKVWKLLQLVGALLLAAGVTSCMLKADGGTMSLLFLAGGALYFTGRFGAWWKHG